MRATKEWIRSGHGTGQFAVGCDAGVDIEVFEILLADGVDGEELKVLLQVLG